MTTWAIEGMGIEDNTGELYAVTKDGEHEISRVTLTSALHYVRDLCAADDLVQYNGNESTGYKWRKQWNIP